MPVQLLRILQLFCSDGRLQRTLHDDYREFLRLKSMDNADEELAKRKDDWLEWARAYLESFNKAVLEDHEHVVRKTLALVGWFTLLFAALSLSVTLLKDVTHPRGVVAWLIGGCWCFGLCMFFVSLFGACRALWRIDLKGDSTAWLVSGRFKEVADLKRERVAELIARIPENTDAVALKAINYQGAVWAFFMATALTGFAALLAIIVAIAYPHPTHASRLREEARRSRTTERKAAVEHGRVPRHANSLESTTHE